MLIRDERPEDCGCVEQIYHVAFDTPAEARLVVRLRKRSTALVSLIVEEGMRLVGHIMFTPVILDADTTLALMGLAPMAVLPDRQRCGFGSALVEEGLVRCETTGFGAVVVLGHPGFYCQFGFEPASIRQISCQYDVPADVFMVRELVPGYLRGVNGCISYHTAFDEL